MKRERQDIMNDILSFLKKYPRSPSSKISVMINYDYKNCLKLLNEMLDEKLIIREEETNSTYWSIKNVK